MAPSGSIRIVTRVLITAWALPALLPLRKITTFFAHPSNPYFFRLDKYNYWPKVFEHTGVNVVRPVTLPERTFTMDSINLNHSQILTTAVKKNPTQPTPENSQAQQEKTFTSSNGTPSVIVTLSPESAQLSHDYKITSRFGSLEELSEHKTRLAATWVTEHELETGTRRPFASAEDERLSKLSMKELMAESAKLPRVDEHGNLQNGRAGTEQGDRISVAKTNLIFEAQHNYKKAAGNVEASVKEFEKHLQDKFKIDPSSYDITFIDGKITAVSTGKNGADNATLKKIQDVLDNPEKIKPAKDLVEDIKTYNEAAFKVIDYQLTQYIYGASQNRYLPKDVSADWLVEGMNYSNATTSGKIHDKYLSIVADAREKYQAAVKDGSHLANTNTDPGIMELTKIRQIAIDNP